MTKTLTILGLAVVLAGCATAVTKELIATGGSRGDGTVELSYEHTGAETPVVNAAQGLATATARCQAWGYSGAEAFGGERRNCQHMTEYGCARWFVTVPYQCTGAGPA